MIISNNYAHCTSNWTVDHCDSYHNDECPECHAEVTPYSSIDYTNGDAIKISHGTTISQEDACNSKSKPYTVIGVYYQNEQIFSHHVNAFNFKHAAAIILKQFSDDEPTIVSIHDGHIVEGEGVYMLSNEFTDSDDSYLNTESYGSGELIPFDKLDVDTAVAWMTLARKTAINTSNSIDEEDCERASQEALRLYIELIGVLPTH